MFRRILLALTLVSLWGCNNDEYVRTTRTEHYDRDRPPYTTVHTTYRTYDYPAHRRPYHRRDHGRTYRYMRFHTHDRYDWDHSSRRSRHPQPSHEWYDDDRYDFERNRFNDDDRRDRD